jgi:hypothetical protein
MKQYLVRVYYDGAQTPEFGILLKVNNPSEAREKASNIAARNKPGAEFHLVDWLMDDDLVPIGL